MSLVPLPINSSRLLPPNTEGLTKAVPASDPGLTSAPFMLADPPDFAEMIADIGKGASGPMDLDGKECCSAHEPKAVLGKTVAAEEDSPTDNTLSAVAAPLVAAAFPGTPELATQEDPNADASGPRRPVPQAAEVSAEPVKGAQWHPDLAKNDGSETFLDGSGRAEGNRQMGDGDVASAEPMDKAPLQGVASRVMDRVISLQEFTFFDGAARNSLPSKPHGDATLVPHAATTAARTEPGAFRSGDRIASFPQGTETVSPQKPLLTAVVEQTGTEGSSSLALSRRDSAAGPQEVALFQQKEKTAVAQLPQTSERVMGRRDSAALTLPKTASYLDGATTPVFISRGDEALGSTSDTGQPQAVPSAVTSIVSVLQTPSLAIEDIAPDAGRAEGQLAPIQPERFAVNKLKTSAPGVAPVQMVQDMTLFGADPAWYRIAVGGELGEGHKTVDMAESLITAANSHAGTVLRPELAMSRIDLPRHVAQQVADVATRAADGPVDLHLNPEELGKVRISMAMADGGITVTILAERQDTLDLMRRHIDQLGQEFRQLGYGLISFSFGQQYQGQDNQSDGGPNQAVSAPLDEQPGLILADGGDGRKNGLDMRI